MKSQVPKSKAKDIMKPTTNITNGIIVSQIITFLICESIS